MLRLEAILKEKEIRKADLARKLGWKPAKLNSRLKGGIKLQTVTEIAKALEIEEVELIQLSKEYSHFYHDTTGEYLGIRKV